MDTGFTVLRIPSGSMEFAGFFAQVLVVSGGFSCSYCSPWWYSGVYAEPSGIALSNRSQFLVQALYF